MVKEKFPKQMFIYLSELLQKILSCFSGSFKFYGITLIGFKIKKTPYVGKLSKNFFVAVAGGVTGCSI